MLFSSLCCSGLLILSVIVNADICVLMSQPNTEWTDFHMADAIYNQNYLWQFLHNMSLNICILEQSCTSCYLQ